MTSTETDLHVPDEAIRLAKLLSFGNGIAGHEVSIMAAPVVAYELHRLADHYEAVARNLSDPAAVEAYTTLVGSLRARGDALNPEGKR